MTTFLNSCTVYSLSFQKRRASILVYSLWMCSRTCRCYNKRSASLSPCFHLIYLSFFNRFPASFPNSDFSEETPGFSEYLRFFPKTWLWIQSVIFFVTPRKARPGVQLEVSKRLDFWGSGLYILLCSFKQDLLDG